MNATGGHSMTVFKRVIVPYATGFGISMYLPQDTFNRAAFQMNHLQSCFMNGEPFYLVDLEAN